MSLTTLLKGGPHLASMAAYKLDYLTLKAQLPSMMVIVITQML